MSKEEKVKKPFYKKWWVWLIAVIVIVAVSSGDDEEVDTVEGEEAETESAEVEENNEEEAEEVSTEEPAEEEEPAEDKTEFDVGEQAELDEQVVTVTNVEKSQGSDFDQPSEGNEYVIVEVEIENHSDETISYNPYNFKMQNSDGQIEDIGIITVDSDTSLSSGDLASGGNVSGTLSFEQPIDDEELQLIFEPGFWSGEQIKFNL
ncbi:hypothetical protein J2Z83_003802 [Virgibacillus natechei]|uniref:DUF4352 domain-containing protein n=1 Tax=Virgibacillus natechei TaxID=1216297 RepID=A0ABS4IL07_9BACI|nr:DUF4352 domain-containing protein [Virgibacillus natechei]MBP1971650.1 hypothetical protein [Virgibacillus natechei]UZD13862.1 DUF4352 domain-containing protein [Virgibacillus natechei]